MQFFAKPFCENDGSPKPVLIILEVFDFSLFWHQHEKEMPLGYWKARRLCPHWLGGFNFPRIGGLSLWSDRKKLTGEMLDAMGAQPSREKAEETRILDVLEKTWTLAWHEKLERQKARPRVSSLRPWRIHRKTARFRLTVGD